MLLPAALYKDEIQRKFQERFYSEDMFFETGDTTNWVPNISDCPDERNFQYAIVDPDGTLVGYICYKVDWYASCAYNFGLISFDKGNVLVGAAVKEVMRRLMCEYQLHRIEWRVVDGNPVRRAYESFCRRYGGFIHTMHDAIKDKYGRYHDFIVFELLDCYYLWRC
jgi:hypothetical protein